MKNNIHPVLYKFYLKLKDTLGAEIVHRRRRKSGTCIEIVFHNELFKYLGHHLNTLKAAEACGYWVVCRRQSKRGHEQWRGRTVYQLYLTPVHPKKRNEAKHLAAQTPVDVTFSPIESTRLTRVPQVHSRAARLYSRVPAPKTRKKSQNYLHMSKISSNFARPNVYVLYDKMAEWGPMARDLRLPDW